MIGIVNIFWIFRTLRILIINRCVWLLRILSCNGYGAMFQVNFKAIGLVISLIRLIIKVVRYIDIALLFIVCNFSSWSSCKSNCLTKFTASIFTIQFSLSRIIDVGNLGCLIISNVSNRYFNIVIAEFNSAACYLILIRCVASHLWCYNIFKRLWCSLIPSGFTSYQILSTIFTKVFALGNSWLSGLAIFKLVINSFCYRIFTVNLLRVVNKVNFISLIYIIVMIKD